MSAEGLPAPPTRWEMIRRRAQLTDEREGATGGRKERKRKERKRQKAARRANRR